ncbi:hypothetical protein [Amycolatopsis jejuensis]|uniref:hypothetical protein n=1 Tax=Amycolatopsis jejuensis TaxID=330084 RepID=UPI001FE17934|nr:hypothetical protein [Amycolatopsis jejuensis]
MPPSRRQPPRSTTPPARRPKVAGLRKPSDAAPASPKPRPRPLPDADPVEVTQELRIPRGGLVRPAAEEAPASSSDSASDAAVDSAAVSAEDSEAASETASAEVVAGVTTEPVDAPEPAEVPDPVEASPVPSRPSPRRKQRDTGAAKPVDVTEAESRTRSAAGFPAVPAQRSAESRTVVFTAVLLVVGVALVALAVIFAVFRQSVADSTDNRALLDVAKTAQVKDQVSKATEALFSYDFNNIKKTEDAASSLLASDDVKAKYNALMGEVKRLAPQQKMVVTCKVTRSAVIHLDGDLARVMVFVDQTSTRADTKQTAAGTAQLHVDAQLQGDKWKITDLDTYKAAPAPGAPPPSSAPPSK